MLLAQRARYVDLDGPLLLARDRRTASSPKAAVCIERTSLFRAEGDKIALRCAGAPG